MADGRHFTDYRPNCDLHASLNKNSMDSNAMRNWMTRNADTIMAGNTGKHAIKMDVDHVVNYLEP